VLSVRDQAKVGGTEGGGQRQAGEVALRDAEGGWLPWSVVAEVAGESGEDAEGGAGVMSLPPKHQADLDFMASIRKATVDALRRLLDSQWEEWRYWAIVREIRRRGETP
jgi:hypothetical protein